MQNAAQPDRLLKTSEVAAIFRVSTRTIARWSDKGLVSTVAGPWRHRRFRESDIRAIIDGPPE